MSDSSCSALNPSLPPLYFTQQPAASVSLSATDVAFGKTNDAVACISLPPEVLHHCVTAFADWGDLAKISCVSKAWSNIMYDAAGESSQAKWELALALLEGTNGLERNPIRAVVLLHDLANLPLKADDNTPRVVDSEVAAESASLANIESSVFAPAIKKIAECYFAGTGVEASAELGLSWLKASHCIGKDAGSAHELALVYEFGRHGVDVDVVAAFSWFRQAAEAGHLEATAELALCYELGCGVEQSDELAVEWYMKAADRGHVASKFSLGEAFEEARGVPQSDADACLWYANAARLGCEDSRKALRRLEDVARIVVPGVGVLLDG